LKDKYSAELVALESLLKDHKGDSQAILDNSAFKVLSAEQDGSPNDKGEGFVF
jgi:hypothetical protein